MFPLTAGAARVLALHAQGIEPTPRARATKEDVLSAIRRMAVLQIDTIHVVARSPYLVLWSRLGDYRPEWLDELLAERRIFEYWAHEACFLPAESFGDARHDMIDPAGLGWKYSHDWVAENRALVRAVLRRVREDGPLRSADFKRTDGRKGQWWGWKPEKRALEMLFSAGELMVARRENFQRVYDVRERVRPDWDDAQLPDAAETRRRRLLAAVRALGVTRASWVADYFRMSGAETRAEVRRLADEGKLLRADVTGWDEPGWIHPDHAGLAEAAAAGSLRAGRTTILSPFDPIVWDRRRAAELFDFEYRLECYVPARKRRWGYFVLPILRRGRLVGRLDAKAHRKDGRMEIRRLWLEEGVRRSAALTRDIAAALTAFAVWHQTPDIVIRRTEPSDYRTELRRALG